MHFIGAAVLEFPGPDLGAPEVFLEVFVLEGGVGGAKVRVARGATKGTLRVRGGARQVAHQLVV